jgi:hypothetical protein
VNSLVVRLRLLALLIAAALGGVSSFVDAATSLRTPVSSRACTFVERSRTHGDDMPIVEGAAVELERMERITTLPSVIPGPSRPAKLVAVDVAARHVAERSSSPHVDVEPHRGGSSKTWRSSVPARGPPTIG